MKNLLLSTIGVLSVSVATPAMAETKEPDFTGPRIGVVLGYDNLQDREGLTYGLVAGVDAPIVKGVTLGVEATLEDSTADGGFVNGSRDIGINLRAGVKVLDRAQLFAKAGYASTRFEFVGTGAGVGLEGFRYGGGVEYALTDNLYITGEYRRTEYEDNLGGRDGALVGFGYRF